MAYFKCPKATSGGVDLVYVGQVNGSGVNQQSFTLPSGVDAGQITVDDFFLTNVHLSASNAVARTAAQVASGTSASNRGNITTCGVLLSGSTVTFYGTACFGASKTENNINVSASNAYITADLYVLAPTSSATGIKTATKIDDFSGTGATLLFTIPDNLGSVDTTQLFVKATNLTVNAITAKTTAAVAKGISAYGYNVSEDLVISLYDQNTISIEKSSAAGSSRTQNNIKIDGARYYMDGSLYAIK